jgi:Ca-activated chloride channel family protein
MARIDSPPDSAGPPVPFLLESTAVRGWITGPVAHVEVTQVWTNPNASPVDGLYIFPLPENAAVTDMKLTVGQRVVQGEMRRREEARRIFEEARREGRIAGLLDQERPNVFAQRIANLLAGQKIEVLIALDHSVRCETGRCEYVFPTVVGPRFIPARQTDPGAIDPPLVAEGRRTAQRFSLRLDLEAGVPLRDVQSPSHAIRVASRESGAARVSLESEHGEILNRDFRLRWRTGGEAPEVGVMAWRDPDRRGEPGVFTLVLTPPESFEPEEVSPRELVFVLDCSGSMMGVPLEAAKNVVRRALGRLDPRDTFQIIRFSDSASGMGARPMPASRDNIRKALLYLDGLQGEGGTEMISGIRAALGFPADPERLRIVAFLTDGYIGNEKEILSEVARRLGSARLFSFGIGSSVNRYLLEGLAEEGRGEAAFLAPREAPEEMVARFVRRISSPLLTDVQITWRDLEVREQLPQRAPDLFAGQPWVLQGRYTRPGTGVVEVEGLFQGRRRIFRRVVTLPESAEDHAALGRLWAKARIHQLERQLHDGERKDVVEAIAALGMRHHLMTAYTSLVAVDSEISNWSGRSESISVPVEMPEDVSYEGFYDAANLVKSMPSQGLASPPPMRTAGKLSALGYAGGGVTRESARKDAPLAALRQDALKGKPAGARPTPTQERDSLAERKEAARPAFVRITLFESSEGGFEIQSDGRVFKVSAGHRVYLKTLRDEQMDSLRNSLTAAHAEGWRGGGSGSRMVLEAAGMQRVIGLPAGDETVEALAALLRVLVSGSS